MSSTIMVSYHPKADLTDENESKSFIKTPEADFDPFGNWYLSWFSWLAFKTTLNANTTTTSIDAAQRLRKLK
jgi:hypothetical protein